MKVVKSTTARAPPPLSLATPPLAHCSDRGHYGSEEERRRYLAQQMLPPIRDEGTSPAVSRCTAGMVERLRITLENRLFFFRDTPPALVGAPANPPFWLGVRTRNQLWAEVIARASGDASPCFSQSSPGVPPLES